MRLQLLIGLVLSIVLSTSSTAQIADPQIATNFVDPMDMTGVYITQRFGVPREEGFCLVDGDIVENVDEDSCNGEWYYGHTGTDLAYGGCGRESVAVAQGVVVDTNEGIGSRDWGYGILYKIKLPNNEIVHVGGVHFENSTGLSRGDEVMVGSRIGSIGDTGFAVGCHAHHFVTRNLNQFDQLIGYARGDNEHLLIEFEDPVIFLNGWKYRTINLNKGWNYIGQEFFTGLSDFILTDVNFVYDNESISASDAVRRKLVHRDIYERKTLSTPVEEDKWITFELGISPTETPTTNFWVHAFVDGVTLWRDGINWQKFNKFDLGQSNDDGINVRSSPGGSVTGEHLNSGDIIQILEGPVFAEIPILNASDRGYYWYKIQIGSIEGWVAQDFLIHFELVDKNESPLFTPLPTPICHTIESPDTTPEGFGVPYSTQTSEHEILIQAECENDQAFITVGNSSSSLLTYVWPTIHYWYNDQRITTELTCTERVNGWCRNSGVTTIDLNPDETWLIGYICQWDGSRWWCGCRDESCDPQSGTGDLWLAQRIQR